MYLSPKSDNVGKHEGKVQSKNQIWTTSCYIIWHTEFYQNPSRSWVIPYCYFYGRWHTAWWMKRWMTNDIDQTIWWTSDRRVKSRIQINIHQNPRSGSIESCNVFLFKTISCLFSWLLLDIHWFVIRPFCTIICWSVSTPTWKIANAFSKCSMWDCIQFLKLWKKKHI